MPHRGYPKHNSRLARRRSAPHARGRLVSFAPTAPPLAARLASAAPEQAPADPAALSRAIEAERRDRERRALAEQKEAERRAAALREEERRSLLAQIAKTPKEDRERLIEESRLLARGRDLAAKLRRSAAEPIDRALVAELFGISIED